MAGEVDQIALIVSLRHDDPSAGSLAVSLAAIKDWTFLLGPGVVVGLGNGLILGYLMLRSGLVPRPMALLGLVAGPLVVVSGIAGGPRRAGARAAAGGLMAGA